MANETGEMHTDLAKKWIEFVIKDEGRVVGRLYIGAKSVVLVNRKGVKDPKKGTRVSWEDLRKRWAALTESRDRPGDRDV